MLKPASPASIELGPYQLLERIGEGGGGQVFRATGPAGPVAIKMLGPASDLDDAALARFRREIDALGQLRHAHLVTLLDHGIDDELGPYLVLPLLAGVNVRALCAGRALCPEAAILLVQPIAEATAALHAAGYVHRDLKPENVIAGPDGAITLIDLGLAWRDGMTRHTDTGAAVGSVGYMAPEQIEARPVGDRADVWALGVMIYEAIAGTRPFARARPAEEAAATVLGRFPRLTAADRRASDELAELVARCLALDPTQRPTAAQLAAELAAMIDWTDAPAADRAAVVADPVGYQARVAPLRVRRLERLAHEAVAAGQPFVALGWCDRGLAYVPDHAGLLALVAGAELATARAPDVGAVAAVVERAAPPPPPPPPQIESLAGSAPLVAAAPSVPPARRSYTWWWISGALAIGFTAVVVYAVIQDRRAHNPFEEILPDLAAATADPSSGASSTSGASGDPSDRAIVHDVASIFAHAMDDHPGASSAADTGNDFDHPTTATGWLTRAAEQPPAQAVVSIRHALALAPEWSDAQAALCVALATAHEDGAVAACTTAIARRPSDVSLLAARGAAHLHDGEVQDAVADLDRVVAADPDPKWRRLRATARSAAGDAAGAQRDLDSACQLGDATACKAGSAAAPTSQ